MVVKPEDLPVLTKEDKTEVLRLEKNIDKALKARWCANSPHIILPTDHLGKTQPIREALRRLYENAGWKVTTDDKNAIFEPRPRTRRTPPIE